MSGPTSLSTYTQLTGEKILISENEEKSSVSLNKPIDSLISDTAIEIFSYLNCADLAAVCSVSKNWDAFTKEDENLWNGIMFREFAFGKEKWAKYFGVIGVEPSLPENIYEILKSPCPVFLGSSVARTHKLMLVPEKVNGTPFTFNSLEGLVNKYKQDHLFGYGYVDRRVRAAHGNTKPDKSRWVLMTKEVPEWTKGDSYYENKVSSVECLSSMIKVIYQVPNLLEAAVCIYMEYVDTRKFLFNNTCTYTSERSTVDFRGSLTVNGVNSPDKRGIAMLRRF